MIPKIAIHGKKDQPYLVIEYLNKLGGHNTYFYKGDSIKAFYWIDDFNRIRYSDNIPEGYQFIDNWYERYDKPIKHKYILVHWPESQYFIGMEDCYYVNPMEDIDLDQAMFVSEETYNKVIQSYDH